MPDRETSGPILLTLEGNNGKIELMESNVRIVLYKEKLHLGMGRKWDTSKIDKVHEIPKDTITKVDLARPLKTYQLHIHFPGAGLTGIIVFFKEEQMPEAKEMMERLQATTEVAKVKGNKNIMKILEKRGISSNDVLIATEGANGQIVLTDKGVIISREGLGNKILVGYTKGEKFLPYRSITGVQFKEPGMTWGYIQFTLPGGIERRGGSWDAGSDENTVTFHNNVLESFRKIRAIVEERQGLGAVPTSQAPVGSSIADELTKLAALKRDGAITEEEYVQLKKDLLSSH